MNQSIPERQTAPVIDSATETHDASQSCGRKKAITDAKADKKVVDARVDAIDEKHDAAYKVATEKCDALSGNNKDACVAQAKAAHGK